MQQLQVKFVTTAEHVDRMSGVRIEARHVAPQAALVLGHAVETRHGEPGAVAHDLLVGEHGFSLSWR
jgi:hypothetical protein